MSTLGSAGRISNSLVSVVVLLLVILALVAAFLVGRDRAGRLRAAVEEITTKSRLVSSMQVDLLAATAAEKSAVMAATDEASKEFADRSWRATEAVEANRSSLARSIETGGKAEQIERLSVFNECWTRYQEINREVLGLAVENTNLKALRLSFFPAAEALDRMQSALTRLIDASAESDPAAKSAYRAMTAALKIYGLHGRHIAEPTDEVMDGIEMEMKRLDNQVGSALSALSTEGGDAAKATVDEARSAYAEFQKVHSEVLSLSRRNSNVRSLAISLGQKRKVAAECEERLNALQESVRRELSSTTRVTY